MSPSIFLIRHCQSFANAERRYNSREEGDKGLTHLGKLQAQYLSRYIVGKKIKKIYHSPFPRAVITANVLAKATHCTAEPMDEFREHWSGEWDGKTELEIVARYPDAWRGWHQDPQNNPMPGGETLLELQARSIPAVQQIVRRHIEENVAIVTHYCVFNVILCSLVSSLANFRCFDTRNATVAEISMDNIPRLKFYGAPLPSNL
jgi:broad specificity phosphatase PhoE